MATAQTGSANSLNTLVGLGNLIQQVTGSSSTTKSSSSTASNITDEGMQRLIQQILAGKGGVKDISGAARGAGLYNSSTEAQMLNDLDARTAGELAARQAGTTTENTSTTSTPGLGLSGVASALALPIASSFLKPVLSKFLGLDQAAATTAGTLGTSGTAAIGGAAQSASAAAAGDTAITGVSPGLSAAGSSVLGSVGGLAIGAPSVAISDSVLGGIGGAATGSLAGDLGLDAAANTASSTLSSGSGAVGSSIPGVGSLLSGFLGGAENGDPYGSPEAFAGAMAAGTIAGGPVGGLIGAAATTIGMALRDVSVICTALHARDLLNTHEYEKGQANLQGLHKRIKRGYYLWAGKVAAKITRGDAWAISISLPVAASRMKLLADESNGIKKYFRYPLGTITRVIGEPICYCIGYALELAERIKDKKCSKYQSDIGI